MRIVKWNLENFHCDNCKFGIVQVRQTFKRGGVITSDVSGCMDCKKDFGIREAVKLKRYEGRDLH